VASSTVEERLPAICGRLTLTTEVSSTSITALDMTAIATSHRREKNRASAGAAIVDCYQ
jgi:hypothetical protein